MTDDGYELIVARPAARAIAETLPEPVAAAVIDFITGSLLENPRRVGRPSKQRTIRILHALALEAQRRGHTLESHNEHRCPGGFEISIDRHRFEVTVYEESRRVPHVLTAKEEARKVRGFDWARRWDDEPTGRLVRAMATTPLDRPSSPIGSVGRSRTASGMSWTNSNNSPRWAEQRRLDWVEAQRHEAARHELEQQAAEDARLLRERVRRLDEQIDRWEHAARIRRFVTAARGGSAADAASLEWLDWANSHADSIDPVVAGLVTVAP